MATQGYVQLPDDSANTGKKEDHVIVAPSGDYREVVTIGGPSADNSYAPVDSTAGLKVDLGADNDVTVTGSVTANAGTNLNTSALAVEAGGHLAAIDTNAGATTDSAVTGDNSGTLSAKIRGLNKILANVWDSVNSRLNVFIQNTTIAVTQSGSWVLSAGSAVIGHVILDSGSTTAVTQATASNLNATIVGTGTLAVQAAATEADGANVTLGAKADAKSTATDTTAVTVMQVLKEISFMEQNPASRAVTNAGTFATQSVLTTGSAQIGHLEANQSVNVAQLAGTTTDTNSGNKSAGTLRVVLATDQPQLTNKLLVTPDANSAVNVAQVGGTNSVTAGVNGTLAVGGNVATNVAIGTNPINLGAQAVSAENTAVTANRMVQLVADLVGKLIVLPYANPENFVSGAITSAMTGTTSTSLIAAPASGLRNYITQITVSNSHATVGTDVIIQDGSGGTTLYTIPAAAVYGGATVTFPCPLRQPTTATAIYCQNVTTGASTKVSASGYKGA